MKHRVRKEGCSWPEDYRELGEEQAIYDFDDIYNRYLDSRKSKKKG